MRVNKSKIACVIKEIRSGLNITQRELAEKSGLTINYLSLLENGKRGIGLERLNDVAKALGVPAELVILLASDVRDKKNKDADRLLRQLQRITHQAIGLYISG